MAWEMRGNCGPYYTRSCRRGGRVVREYVGGGTIGQLAAELDDQERAQRRAHRDSLLNEIRSCVADDQTTYDFCESVEALMRAELILAGYRRHERGEWRKRRETDC